MRPPAALALVLLVPLSLASTSAVDPVGDERFVQLSPGPDVAPLLGGCRDPAMDILSYDMASDGNFINGSIVLVDGEGTPTCGATPMWRHEGYASIRLQFAGGQRAVVSYEFTDICLVSIWTGTNSAVDVFFPGLYCTLENDVVNFSFPLAGNVRQVTYNFGGIGYDAFAGSAELVSIVPVLQDPEVFNGRILDLAGVPGG